MKFKTTAIAMAVAGSVVAPMAVQAEGELYASARVGLWNNDTNGVSELDVKSFSSRFGGKGETDLGNGLSAIGRFEWDIDENAFLIRQRWVGLKGDFGTVKIGKDYQTFYNFTTSAVDQPWWYSGYNMMEYSGRSDNGLTYSGSSGGFAYGATAYFNNDAAANPTTGEEGVDGIEVGASFAIGNMTLGVAYADFKGVYLAVPTPADENSVVSVSLSGIELGSANLAVNVQSNDNQEGIVAHLGVGNFYYHVEMMSNDMPTLNYYGTTVGEDPISHTIGYTQSLGRGTSMYYELFQWDKDTGNSDDDRTSVMAVLKFDII